MHVTDKNLIREIEEHSLKSTPALKSTDYDGWIIREAKGQTKRANSVNFLSAGSLPLIEKIETCEKYYTAIDQPCIFRLTPLAMPQSLDSKLEARDYQIIDKTDIRVRDLKHHPPAHNPLPVHMTEELSEEWVEAISRLTGKEGRAPMIKMEMFSNLTLKPVFASIKQDNEIVACGLGILSDHLIGLFEFATNPDHMRKGYAKSIVDSLLLQAANNGVSHAYLQVVKSNEDGQNFWKALGFEETLYGYHYRIKI